MSVCLSVCVSAPGASFRPPPTPRGSRPRVLLPQSGYIHEVFPWIRFIHTDAGHPGSPPAAPSPASSPEAGRRGARTARSTRGGLALPGGGGRREGCVCAPAAAVRSTEARCESPDRGACGRPPRRGPSLGSGCVFSGAGKPVGLRAEEAAVPPARHAAAALPGLRTQAFS